MQALIRLWGPSDCVVFCLQSAHGWGSRHKNYGFPSNSGPSHQFAVSGRFRRDWEGSPSERPRKESGINKESCQCVPA